MQTSNTHMLEPPSSNPSLLRRALVLGAVVANVAFNYVSERLPLGDTTRAISDRYATFFTPAPYTFAIWGLIYGAFIAYAIAGLLPSQRRIPLYDHLAYPLIGVNALATMWLLLFRQEWMGAALGVIALMLALGAYMFRSAHRAEATDRTSRWRTVPFSLFFGWITVAAFANLESYVVYTGNTGSILVAPAGAVLLMILATVVSVLVAFALRDASFPAVVAWAMFGIAVASRGVDRVSTFATFCAVTCLVLSSYSLYAQRKHPRFKPPKHGPLPVAKAHRAELETYS